MQTPKQDKFWKKAIVFVDMNAFFASIEQLDYPQWRGKPIAVTNGEQGTCIITCSYEARRFGIKTGMRLQQARRYCPQLIQCPARPKRYAQVSAQIMTALESITPDLEVFSVDEAFLDVSRCQRLWGHPIKIARLVKETVSKASHLPCSVGVSASKAIAKFAASCHKPDGFAVILPWDTRARLEDVPVTQLCGVGEGIASFLAQFGVYTCGDVARLPIHVLARRFGDIGRRIWMVCRGEDIEPLHVDVKAPKSMGHGKVMPPNIRNYDQILTYLMHMSEKLAARLRKNYLKAQQFYIAVRSQKDDWIGGKYRLVFPSDDGQFIYQLAKTMLDEHWSGQGLCQVQVTATDPRPARLCTDFFQLVDTRRLLLNEVVDEINQRYGEFTLSPARLLERSSMPNVIAPAWKPQGHRQTIS